MPVWCKHLLLAVSLSATPFHVGCGPSMISEEDAAEQEKVAGADQAADNANDGGGKKRPEIEEAQ